MTDEGKRVVIDLLERTVEEHGLGVEGLQFRAAGCYAIQNSIGCDQPQGSHTDYSEGAVGYLRDTPHYPRSAIWAACADFEFEDGGGRVILVPRGHVICFMASFFYGGRPYMSDLPRFHCFYLPEYVHIPGGIYS